MRILVTGAAGMLGGEVCRTLAHEHELIATDRSRLDVTDRNAVLAAVRTTRPHWVIHLAALTDVDRCQREPEQALQVNTGGTENVAHACRQTGANLLFLSSIAVFDGQKSTPYHEQDQPRPINQYGMSKWLAEQVVAELPGHLIVRSGWLFGGGEADKKFVSKILSLAASRKELSVVSDKIGSPTSVTDLAVGLAHLLRDGKRGLFHLVNDGEPVSRFGLAAAIVQEAGLSPVLRPVTSDYFPALAPRPDMEAAVSLTLPGLLPPWRDSLAAYIVTRVPAAG